MNETRTGDRQFLGAFRSLLERLGEDPRRPGLLETPKRMLETYLELTRGLREDIDEELKRGLFEEETRGIVLVKGIEFVSLCEHHMVPFLGHVHVAYAPAKRVLGISKIGRVVDHYSYRPQLQERLTAQVVDKLYEVLEPKGVCVVVDAVHLCMMARGRKKQDASVVSVAVRGDDTLGKELREVIFK